MKESIEERIRAVKEAENYDELKKHLCPFFEDGGCPDCFVCKKDDDSLEECRDYYISKIFSTPQDLWDAKFDGIVIKQREEVIPVEEISGIGINCDNCYMYDKCPLYRKGYSCGIKWGSNKPNSTTEFMDFLIDTQYERVKRSAVFEKIDGGVPDMNLSGEIDRLHGLVMSKNDMGRERFSLNVEATGSATNNGGGILAKLFGGNALPAEKEPIEIPSTAEPLEITTNKEIEKPKVKRKEKANE